MSTYFPKGDPEIHDFRYRYEQRYFKGRTYNRHLGGVEGIAKPVPYQVTVTEH